MLKPQLAKEQSAKRVERIQRRIELLSIEHQIELLNMEKKIFEQRTQQKEAFWGESQVATEALKAEQKQRHDENQ